MRPECLACQRRNKVPASIRFAGPRNCTCAAASGSRPPELGHRPGVPSKTFAATGASRKQYITNVHFVQSAQKRGVDLAGISVRPVMPQAALTAEVLGSKTPHVSVHSLDPGGHT